MVISDQSSFNHMVSLVSKISVEGIDKIEFSGWLFQHKDQMEQKTKQKGGDLFEFYTLRLPTLLIIGSS